ncbi:MAG: radical SAM protein, partial [Candidatus Schekmanbacteria bacterium RBG_16_38_11]
ETVKYTPSYLELFNKGIFQERVSKLKKILHECTLCPRNCGVNRLKGEKGFCGAGPEACVSSVGPHFGEEAPLAGRNGSGTIFFTYCNLGCVFCQNYDISHLGHGEVLPPSKLASQMLYLYRIGCHNINLVTPTHFVPQISEAIMLAIKGGLKVPIVFNCGGYESVEVLKLLEGIIDIYMPDAKFSDPKVSEKLCHARDYYKVLKEALKEMHRQVGVLKTDETGIASRGVLIRHLVMPNETAGSEEVLRFIAEELSKDSYVNIMRQYYPCYKAGDYPEISRSITPQEYNRACEIGKSYGLKRGFLFG